MFFKARRCVGVVIDGKYKGRHALAGHSRNNPFFFEEWSREQGWESAIALYCSPTLT